MSPPLTDDELVQIRAVLACVGETGVNIFDQIPWLMWKGRTGFGTTFLAKAAPRGHVYTREECAELGWPSELIGTTSAGPACVVIDTKDRRSMYIECGAQDAADVIAAIELFVSIPNPHGKNVGIRIVTQGAGHGNVPLQLGGEGIEVLNPGRFLVDREQDGVWLTPQQLFQS